MQRKSNRLNLENYQGYNIYYLTLNCANRASYFVDEKLVNKCLDELRKLNKKFNFKIWAYCFMPDHLHILIESDKCLEVLRLFKQTTGYYFKQSAGKSLWQKSFYDHILRKEEDLIGTISYILNNPVRANLVENSLDYQHSGSFQIDMKDFMMES